MPSRSNERLVLLITSLASFLTPFMSSSVNVALPAIGREFSVSAVALGWVATSFLLAAAVGLVPIGRLADLRGRRRVFTTGLVVYTAGSFLCALAPSHLVLIAFRVVQGSGGAMIFGTATALLTSTFPASGRGRALGWNVASVYTGLSLGPFLGGILTQNLGWRSLFLTNVPLGVVILSLALWGMKEEKVEPQGASFDAPGALIYGAGLVALMIGFSTLPGPRSLFLLLSGIGGLVAFALRQMRAQSPLLDLRLFLRTRTLALSNLAALINYSATAAVGFLLSLYLQYNRLLGPQAAGLVLVAQSVPQALLSPVAARLSDRVQPRLAGRLLCPLLLPKHERRHERRRPARLRGGRGNARHHAHPRPDVQPGDRDAPLLRLHRRRGDRSRQRPAFPDGGAGCLRDLLRALPRGSLRVLRSRQRAQSLGDQATPPSLRRSARRARPGTERSQARSRSAGARPGNPRWSKRRRGIRP